MSTATPPGKKKLSDFFLLGRGGYETQAITVGVSDRYDCDNRRNSFTDTAILLVHCRSRRTSCCNLAGEKSLHYRYQSAPDAPDMMAKRDFLQFLK